MKRKNSQSPKSDEPAAIDPQDFIRRATQSVADRKALQLCRQIERTIGLVISGELDDDRVRDLMVLSVVPAPHSNHLLVTLQAAEMMTDRELIELDALLFRHKGALRTAIAQSTNRRKTPDLTLRVINPPA